MDMTTRFFTIMTRATQRRRRCGYACAGVCIVGFEKIRKQSVTTDDTNNQDLSAGQLRPRCRASEGAADTRLPLPLPADLALKTRQRPHEPARAPLVLARLPPASSATPRVGTSSILARVVWRTSRCLAGGNNQSLFVRPHALFSSLDRIKFESYNSSAARYYLVTFSLSAHSTH